MFVFSYNMPGMLVGRGTMMLKTTVLICLILMVQNSCGKVYDNKCKLTNELLRDTKLPKSYMKNWVCLIDRVSKMDTAAFTEVWEREKYYGLFKIGLEWCKEGRKGGKCDIACESLLDDNIKDDAECALKIREEVGFKYWKQYSPNCAGILVYPDIEKCPDWKVSSARKRRAVKLNEIFVQLFDYNLI